MNGWKWFGTLVAPVFVIALLVTVRQGRNHSEYPGTILDPLPNQYLGEIPGNEPKVMDVKAVWADLMAGWNQDDAEKFQKAMNHIMDRGPEMVPELQTRMNSRNESLESRLFAAELLLRMDRNADRKSILRVFDEICLTVKGRQGLENLIKNKGGEVVVYDLALRSIKSSISRERMPEILENLQSENPVVRVQALEELSGIPVEIGMIRERVRELLQDANVQVRSAGLELIPDVFPRMASTLLTDFLEKDVDPQIVLHAGRVLARVANPADLPKLEELLKLKDRPSTQLAATHIIVTMKDNPSPEWVGEIVLPEIWTILDDPAAKTAHRAGAAVLLVRLIQVYKSDLGPGLGQNLEVILANEKDPWVATHLKSAKEELPVVR